MTMKTKGDPGKILIKRMTGLREPCWGFPNRAGIGIRIGRVKSLKSLSTTKERLSFIKISKNLMKNSILTNTNFKEKFKKNQMKRRKTKMEWIAVSKPKLIVSLMKTLLILL